jgi:hypothetical protein
VSEKKSVQTNAHESQDTEAAPVVIRPAPNLDGLEAGMDLPAMGASGFDRPIASPSIASDDAQEPLKQEQATSESTIDASLKADPSFSAGARTQAASESAAPGANRFALLAAAVALAAALGAMIGSATTAGIAYLAMASDTSSPATRVIDPTKEIHALKTIVAKSQSDISKLKASIDSTARLASTQFARITDRMEHNEKAQNDPATKLAAIQDSLGRIERRVALSAIPANTVTASNASSGDAHAKDDVTGSIPAKETAPKERTLAEQARDIQAKDPQAKPDRSTVVTGWVLRDIYRGRALVESRYAGVFEVGPGSMLPGVGRVETIKRQDGKWVVVTPKGIITSMR